MKYIAHYLLLIIATFLFTPDLYSQSTMVVKMKDGNHFDFSVPDIDEIIWEEKEEEPEDNPGDGSGGNTGELTVTGDAFNITYFTACISAYANIINNLSTDTKIGFIWGTDDTLNKNSGTQIIVPQYNISSDGKYNIVLTDLSENTTYYYRSFVLQSGIWRYGTVKSFTTATRPSEAVTFANGLVTEKTCFSAKVSATVKIAHGMTYSSFVSGIKYGTTSDTKKTLVSDNKGEGTYSITLRALKGNTVYYYRPYAVVQGKEYLGEISTFQTLEDNVVITGTIDENYVVKSKLTLDGGEYKSLSLGLKVKIENRNLTASGGYSDLWFSTNELDNDDCFSFSLDGVGGNITYQAFVYIDGERHYGEKKSIYINPYEPVDLGLPSGTLWAKCNLGASSSDEKGDCYAWGETEPKNNFSWENYKWCNGSENTLTKYCSSSDYGIVDNKITLDLEDDAAYVNWGGDWRIPTAEDFEELTKNCDGFSNDCGIVSECIKLVSKINGRVLYFPYNDYFTQLGVPYFIGRYGTSTIKVKPDTRKSYYISYRYMVDDTYHSCNLYDEFRELYYGTLLRPVCGGTKQ